MHNLSTFDKLSYLAGALDATCRFRFNDRGATIQTKVLPEYILNLRATTLGGEIAHEPGVKGNFWRCPADEQPELCRRMMGLLQVNKDSTSVIYQYRMTQPKRKWGWKVTPPVKTFRTRLLKLFGGKDASP